MTEYGYGIGTPLAPLTISNYSQSPGLTLDMFSRIMDYDPCEFMGVMENYECSPLTSGSRRNIIQAEENAIQMVEDEIARRGRSLFDQNVKLTSRYPYFKLSGYLPSIITYKQYMATVTVDDNSGECDTFIATITATIDALGPCDQLYGISFLWSGRKRLGIELLSGPTLTDVTLEATAYAYNFIDIDAFDGTVPPDSIPYVSTVTINVAIISPAVPSALWHPDYCVPDTDPCLDITCRYIVTNGCLREGLNGVYDVRDYWERCTAYFPPVKFEVTVISQGLWTQAFADAIVSLANTRLPDDFCGCNRLRNARFMDDNGKSERYSRTYPYSFNNGFGILAPGAQYAWKTIERAVSNTILMKN